MRFRFETNGMNLAEIGHAEICTGAKFVLDKPIAVTIDDVLILENGEWYLETKEEPIRLQGRWVDERASNSSQNIKAPKKPRIRNSQSNIS